MDVRVKQQILSPCVEDGEEPDLCAEVLWVGGNGFVLQVSCWH